MNSNTFKKLVLIIAFLVLFTMLVSGCTKTLLKKYIRPGLDYSKIGRIAVLPFENFTSDDFADEKIRSLVIIDLLSRGVDVIEPGEVLRILNELKVRSIGSLSTVNIQNIGKILKVNAVMTGSVGAFEIRKGISVSSPEVTVSIMLYESSSGSTLWSVWHTSGGPGFATRHFGVENETLGVISKKVIREALNTLY